MSAVASTNVSRAANEDFGAIRWLLLGARLPSVGVEPEQGTFFVCHARGEVVACAGLQLCGQASLLRSVAVHQEHRGCGLGNALVGKVIELSRQHGLDALYLLTQTATRYFSARGFSVVERHAAPEGIRDCWEFRLGCPGSAALMKLRLR